MKKILVSQPKPENGKSPYYDLQDKYDVEVVLRPFIKVEGLSAKEFRQHKVAIPDFSAIIFTARTAVDHFFRLCQETRYNVPDTLKYFCVSEAIAYYLQKYIIYRKRKIFFSETGRAEDLIPILEKHNKETYLLPISESVEDNKVSVLDAHNIKYTKVPMYRTVSNDFRPDEKFDYDMLVFFSPSGVKALKSNFPDFEQGDIVIGAMGKTTIEAVEQAGLRLDLTTSPEAPSMSIVIDHYLRDHCARKDE
jgi:uroporphyrinogen-III synthase